ncbi:hypothetical protein MTR_3g030280 [Medicago truncatula]|uniref:Putative plant transposon protein domain-containing protein n=1 Tax=Medicago truncatula TaxID=3880 RepID=G7IWQ2_MEDTR|nr:hypothetical protein MTR_3g030280 [Medicago truncatula]
MARFIARMAPKKPVNTGKRKKGETSTSQPPPRNQPFDRERFKSRYHQDRYKELLKQSMWLEKVFNINPQGPYQDLLKVLTDQGWGRLLQPITAINAELVREFYANALPENLTDPFVYETFVRGRTIRFDREAINIYLGNNFPLSDEDEMDEFHDNQNRGTFNIEPMRETIKRAILLEGETYDVSNAGRHHRAQYKLMNKTCKFILKFILHNVRPNSHLSDCTVDVCPLIYYILKGFKVDIARTLAWELRLVTLQGKSEPKTRLAFPGLIMGLIKDSRMKFPTAVHEELRNPVDDDFIKRYIMSDPKPDKGKQASSSGAPPPRPQPSSEPQPHFPPHLDPHTAAFDFASFAQWQYQCHTHTWNMLDATNRANTYLQQSQYVMQQQAGYPPEVMSQFMTPEAYQAHVSWPEGRPDPYGGGGSSFGMLSDDILMGDSDRDDPDRVPSATGGSDDDDMQGLELKTSRKEKKMKKSTKRLKNEDYSPPTCHGQPKASNSRMQQSLHATNSQWRVEGELTRHGEWKASLLAMASGMTREASEGGLASQMLTWHKPNGEETSTRHGKGRSSRGELVQNQNSINSPLNHFIGEIVFREFLHSFSFSFSLCFHL